MSDASSPVHRKWMKRCLALAKRGEGKCSPNPMVGAVILSAKGEKIAEGYHRGVGTPHAEQHALSRLSAAAKGATLYTNLEPCHHRDGGRLPCSQAIADAGIAHVVYGARDPIADHAGGNTWLKRKGLKVTGPVLEAECEDLNAGFFSWARRKRPYVIGKAAATLDGRIATAKGESKWITGEAARADGHRLRLACDSILVGVETVLADDPSLTYRGKARGADPMRILLDSMCRTPLSAKVLPHTSSPETRVVVACTDKAPQKRQDALEAAGAEVWRLGQGPRVSLKRVLTRLGKERVLSLLVEGGGTVHRSLLDAGLMDELHLYLAPMALAGGPGWVAGPSVATLSQAYSFEQKEKPKFFGPDTRFRLVMT